MAEYPTTGSTSVDVNVSPEVAWALVSDVTRIGEFSPECRRAEWTSGDSLEVGNRFRGYNELADGSYKWDVECELTAVAPGQSFTYSVPPGFEHATEWSFAVEATQTGSRIVQSFNAPMLALPDVYPGTIEGRCAQLQKAIDITTSNLKATLEQ